MPGSEEISGKNVSAEQAAQLEGGHVEIPDKSGAPPEGGSDIQKILIKQNERAEEEQRRAEEEQRRKMHSMLLYESVELLKRCKAFPMRPEDLERAGGIGDAYTKARLKPEIIQLLLEGKHDEYLNAMANGAFIFGFYEEPLELGTEKHGLSVHQQMLEGLTRTPEMQRNKGTYKGWYLAEKEGAPVLAWLTSSFPPQGLAPKEFKKTEYCLQMERIMEHGVTGGGLVHFSDVDRLEEPEKIWNFDTVQGVKKFAAHRLLTDVTDEVVRDYPELETIALYHLEKLDFMSKENARYKELQNIQKFPAENSKSAKIFRSRGCQNTAFEQNPLGHASLHTVNEKELYCVPGWMWKKGDIRTFQQRSHAIWRDITGEGNAPADSGEVNV